MNLTDTEPEPKVHIPGCCPVSHWAGQEPDGVDLILCSECGGLKHVLACSCCSCDCEEFISVHEINEVIATLGEPDIIVTLPLTRPAPVCFRCGKTGSETGDYCMTEIDGTDLDEDEEARGDGTYNHATNTFCCTECYIKIGMPSSPQGWKAPARIS